MKTIEEAADHYVSNLIEAAHELRDAFDDDSYQSLDDPVSIAKQAIDDLVELFEKAKKAKAAA
jgi:hypothetical protein